jgi:AGZA family xanthine/uracil permease-like MFS transporter
VSERGSTIHTEVKAGLISFTANLYNIVVVPQVLHNGGQGLAQEKYVLGFCVATFASSVIVGLSSNLPIPAGVGVGCTTYFAFNLVKKNRGPDLWSQA